jgi:hypothetical protein
MQDTTPTSAANPVIELDTFLDVVYDDPELVRAEFDDLIAACWDDSPPTLPRRSRRPPPRPRPQRPRAPELGSRPAPRQGGSVHARQRGPPADAGRFPARAATETVRR